MFHQVVFLFIRSDSRGKFTKQWQQFNRILIPSLEERYSPCNKTVLLEWDWESWSVWEKSIQLFHGWLKARTAPQTHWQTGTKSSSCHSGDTWPPQRPGSPLPFTGVTPWRGDTLPSLPMPWLGSNPCRGSHGSATAGLYCARLNQLHHGWSFSGLKGWSDLQLNHRVWISIPSCLSGCSQLKRGIWCFTGIPGVQGNRKETSQEQESWRHSRVIPFKPLRHLEWACVTRRDPVTKRAGGEGKPTPPTCLMWVRVIVPLSKKSRLNHLLKVKNNNKTLNIKNSSLSLHLNT